MRPILRVLPTRQTNICRAICASKSCPLHTKASLSRQSLHTSSLSCPSRASQAIPLFRQTRLHSNDAPVERSKRLPEFDLTGKVIIVSGGARGLGLVQAEALLETGATVYVLDRLPEPSPQFHAIADRATLDLSTTLTYRQVDVRDNFALNAIVENIAFKHNRLDGLIAAAGIQQETPALEYTQEDVNAMFETNVTGVFMTAQAVARQMIKTGTAGSMVLIGSMSAGIANRGVHNAAYNASKAAVLQLARSLAAEWGEHGIRVNTVSPGYMVTPMMEQLFVEYPERKEKWPHENMLDKLSSARDYRGVAVFLLSDASSFMTAADLRIDGGHAAW